MSKYMIAVYLVLGIILVCVIGVIGKQLLSCSLVPAGLDFGPSKED